MNEVVMLGGAEPSKILQAVVGKKVPAIMSYLAKGKWHIVKVLVTDSGVNRFNVEVSLRRKPLPMNIQVNQTVGISFKYEYGKFIFDTTVIDFEPSPDPTRGGMIVLAMPDRIEIVQRRSYFRVDVPQTLKVNVQLWHRCYTTSNRRILPDHHWEGQLIDISAGGAQVAIDTAQRPDFKIGQFIELTFTPMPYEEPLMFDAQIRNILPTADEKSMCLGLQIVGLEANSQGQQILSRLVRVVEQYHQINQSGATQQDAQPGFSFCNKSQKEVPQSISS